MILHKLLRTDLPIIQAPMAGVQGSALAIAVCNAAGLGSIPCAMLGVDAIRKELEALRAQTTKPFNVNVFCHTQPEPSASSARPPGGLHFRRTTPSTASMPTPFRGRPPRHLPVR
jgi:NAD(P)H-dependent flavin oxidoreductase YrpB (nitropropane dioxygenase family)